MGDKAQLPVYRSATGNLKLDYAQFEELETFSRFGARLDERSLQILEHGRRIRAVLRQPQLEPVPVPEQICLLLALTKGFFDPVPLDKMKSAEQAVRDTAKSLPDEIVQEIFSSGGLSEAGHEAVLKLSGKTLAPFKEEAHE